MHLYGTHVFLQPYCQGSFNSLKKSGSSPVFFYLNICYIAVTTPPVCPFYSSATRIIRNIVFVQFFAENQDPCTTWTPKELMRGEKDRIKLTHFIGRVHININIGSRSRKIYKAVSMILMHYLCQFIIWREITGYIGT